MPEFNLEVVVKEIKEINKLNQEAKELGFLSYNDYLKALVQK